MLKLVLLHSSMLLSVQDSRDVELLLGWSLVLSCACRLHSEGEVQAEEVMISFGPVIQHVADV